MPVVRARDRETITWTVTRPGEQKITYQWERETPEDPFLCSYWYQSAGQQPEEPTRAPYYDGAGLVEVLAHCARLRKAKTDERRGHDNR